MKGFLKTVLFLASVFLIIGLCLCVTAFAMGVKWLPETESFGRSDFSEGFSNVKSLSLDVGAGEVKIATGSTFNVEAKNINKGSFESFVDSDGTLVVKYTKVPRFGTFNIGRWRWTTPIITVTLPESFEAQNLKMSLGAGEVYARKLMAKHADLNVDAGAIHIEELRANYANLKVDVGELSADNVNFEGSNIECGVGHVSLNGTMTGSNYVKCDIGAVDLTLLGNPDNYSYSMNVDIGEINLNGDKYSGLGNSTTTLGNSAAVNSFDVNCSIGKISLNIGNGDY